MAQGPAINKPDVLDRVGRLLGIVASITNPVAVTGTFWQATQPVSGTFFQATQPVSLATNTPDVIDRVGRALGVVASITAVVHVDDNAASLTVDAPVGTPVFVELSDGAAALKGQKVMASSLPVTMASDQNPLRVQEEPNGRSSVNMTAEAVAGIITETAITMTVSKANAATATGTSFTPTSGKNLRITAILVAWVSTTTTGNTCRIRARVNASGAATTASPLQFSSRIGWESATFIANEAEFQPITIPEGFEVPNGGGLMFTLACVAANGTLDISLFGYEYTP